VARARDEIRARGAQPVALRVEPSGAELTAPASSFEVLAGTDAETEPDAAGRILRDPGKFVHVHSASVPPTVAPGDTTRVHLEFRPDAAREAHWNNEQRGLLVWFEPPAGWQVDRRRVELDNPPRETSTETRRIELEIKSPVGVEGAVDLAGYALYYVCEGIQGQCLYRRQDISVALAVGRPN
jgi:hypothetical protein